MGLNAIPYKLLAVPIVSFVIILWLLSGGYTRRSHPQPPPKDIEKLVSIIQTQLEQTKGKLADAERRISSLQGGGGAGEQADGESQKKLPVQNVADFPSCLLLTGIGVGDNVVAGYYCRSVDSHSRVFYSRRTGVWVRGEVFLFQDLQHRWVLADRAFDPNANFYYVSAVSDLPHQAKSWAYGQGGDVGEAFQVLVREDGECDPRPSPDGLTDGLATTLREIKKGVDYEADFDIEHPENSTQYDYPSHPSFRYVEHVDGAKIPYKIVSYLPRIYYFPSFITDEECDHIISIAAPKIKRSGVVPYKGSNASEIQDIRTSSQTWLTETDPIVRRVMDRVVSVTGFTRQDHEAMQILRYGSKQKYDAHHDYFDPVHYGAQKTNRAITAFLYFSTVDEGGETWFPRANGHTTPSDFSQCKQGFRVLPRKGAAAFFYDMRPDNSLDEYSLHGGCPVKQGTKWGGTLWLHKNVQ